MINSTENRQGASVDASEGGRGEAPKVVLVYPLPDRAGEVLLESDTNLVRLADGEEETLRAALVDADAVVLRGPAKLTAELLAAASGLRVIGAVGSGTDNIDVDAATERGIPVVHGAGLAPGAVAEWVVGAMVACHRGFVRLDRAVRAGSVDWAARPTEHRATELTGTVLGVIGYGFIGRTVAELAQRAFDAEVVVYDPVLADDDDLGSVKRAGRLDDLLDQSLTVTVHVPLLPSTRGLLGEAELRRIGPVGVLLNASRGGVVDEGALVRVLREGALKAAAVDVFADEPPTAAQVALLDSAPNLLLSPHVAGITDRALRALSLGVAESVLAVLAGRRPERVVNPAVLP
jgi:phosphoglycerate dehydrogenase-like enzyme